jgi:hypothetical protein
MFKLTKCILENKQFENEEDIKTFIDSL